jgi:hypothetical protein
MYVQVVWQRLRFTKNSRGTSGRVGKERVIGIQAHAAIRPKLRGAIEASSPTWKVQAGSPTSWAHWDIFDNRREALRNVLRLP